MKKAITTSNISATKRVQPIIVERIHSTADLDKDFKKIYEKNIITGNLPVQQGMIRCIVLIDYKGMLDDLYAGDVVDLPERRYKSLINRGVVKEYKGNRIPNKQR